MSLEEEIRQCIELRHKVDDVQGELRNVLDPEGKGEWKPAVVWVLESTEIWDFTLAGNHLKGREQELLAELGRKQMGLRPKS